MATAIKVELPSIEAIDFELETRRLEADLYEFLLWVFKVIYKRPFLANWHHKTLCKILMAIHKGDLRHTLINIPPRYTKTEIVVKVFVAWCFAKRNDCEFMHLAYSDDLALSNSSATKTIISSVEFQSRWYVPFKQDSTAKKKWKTETGGEFGAMASGGAVTGFGAGKLGATEFAGALIVDDPLKPEDSNSDTIRNGINNRFPQTIKSRLNDRKTPMIVIMQRLHEDDPVGFLLDGGTELDFTHISLPAINEDGPSEYDPREKGEALWYYKHTEEELEDMRLADAGTYAGQYQQRPAPKDGNIFKHFHFYKEIPDDLRQHTHSWDMTFKEKSKRKKGKIDFVVGTEWAKRRSNGDIYLLPDMVRARMDYTDTEDAVVAFISRHKNFKAILIEDKANGSAIISRLKKAEGVKRVIEVEPEGDKVERAEAVAPLFKAKNVYLPHKILAPWIEDFVNELKVFPNGKFDDQVDSTTQAVEYLDGIGNVSMKTTKPKGQPFRKTFEKRRRDRKPRIKIASD